MSDEVKITLVVKMKAEVEVHVPINNNSDVEAIKNREADKAFNKYVNNPRAIAYEEFEVTDVDDVEVKGW